MMFVKCPAQRRGGTESVEVKTKERHGGKRDGRALIPSSHSSYVVEGLAPEGLFVTQSPALLAPWKTESICHEWTHSHSRRRSTEQFLCRFPIKKDAAGWAKWQVQQSHFVSTSCAPLSLALKLQAQSRQGSSFQSTYIRWTINKYAQGMRTMSVGSRLSEMVMKGTWGAQVIGLNTLFSYWRFSTLQFSGRLRTSDTFLI